MASSGAPGTPPSGYQPQWIDGREVGVGLRDCHGRYKAIAKHIPKTRGLRVLDLGAYNGYFCRRLVDDFDARCVAVDSAAELEPYCNVSVIRRHITPADIYSLGRFDVALCLSVLHHYPNWAEYLRALLDTSTTAFVESANPAENLGFPKTQWAQGLHYGLQNVGHIIHWSANIHGTHLRPLWMCGN